MQVPTYIEQITKQDKTIITYTLWLPVLGHIVLFLSAPT